MDGVKERVPRYLFERRTWKLTGTEAESKSTRGRWLQFLFC